MPESRAKLAPFDPVWQRICEEANAVVRDEPLLGGVMHNNLLLKELFQSKLCCYVGV